MKKAALCLFLAVLALAVDGSLSFDLFDFRIDSPGHFILVALLVFMVAMIVIDDTPAGNNSQPPQ